MPIDESAVVKCFGCSKWVRISATDTLGTIEEGEFPVNVRWCLKCIKEINETTEEVIDGAVENTNLPQWDLDADIEEN
jgi:hypothetical protein